MIKVQANSGPAARSVPIRPSELWPPASFRLLSCYSLSAPLPAHPSAHLLHPRLGRFKPAHLVCIIGRWALWALWASQSRHACAPSSVWLRQRPAQLEQKQQFGRRYRAARLHAALWPLHPAASGPIIRAAGVGFAPTYIQCGPHSCHAKVFALVLPPLTFAANPGFNAGLAERSLCGCFGSLAPVLRQLPWLSDPFCPALGWRAWRLSASRCALVFTASISILWPSSRPQARCSDHLVRSLLRLHWVSRPILILFRTSAQEVRWVVQTYAPLALTGGRSMR